jgi:hypothetical protein
MRFGGSQSAMRPSLYRFGMVFPDLELCFPQNKGLRDKIGLDLNFPRTNRDRRSDRQPLAAPGWLKSVVNICPSVFGELQRSKNIQTTDHLTTTR